MRYPQSPWVARRVRLHRWDEIALEKVTEMLSRKIVAGDREMLVQSYVKRGCLVPMHAHDSEQMTYVLQGALKFLVGGEEITVREGEVLHIPAGVEHQAEALEDTFELDVFSPGRSGWRRRARRSRSKVRRSRGSASTVDRASSALVDAPVPVVRASA